MNSEITSPDQEKIPNGEEKNEQDQVEKLSVNSVRTQNLQWKLGQQAPSFGSILACLETTA